MKKIIAISIMFASSQLNAQLQITNGVELKITGTTVLTLQDINLVNDGTFNQTEGTVRFSGNINNTIGGDNVIRFYNLQMAKVTNSKISLLRTVSADNEVVFSGGNIDLNGFTLLLNASALLIGENENSRITELNGGYVEITNTLNNPVSVNPGNLGAILTSPANMGSTRIRRGHQSQTNGAGAGNSILCYYDITPANNTALNATLRFHYFNAELNGLAENNLVLWKSINNTNWTNEGYTTRDMTMNYVEKTGIPAFSRWTLSSVGNALPVMGLKLSGRWHNNASQLDWVTLAEYNNRHFNVERKYNNENNFTVIGIKNSLHADGNSQSPSSYHWIDPAAANKGNIFYRLQQVDLDGKSSYSNTVAIRPNVSRLFVEKLYPSVGVQQSIYMQIGNLDLKQVEISLYDMAGRLYMKKKVNYESQWLQLPSLTAGAYQLHIVSGEWQHQSNFIKQ